MKKHGFLSDKGKGINPPPPPRGVTLNGDVGKESTIMTIIRRDQSLRLLAQLCSR